MNYHFLLDGQWIILYVDVNITLIITQKPPIGRIRWKEKVYQLVGNVFNRHIMEFITSSMFLDNFNIVCL